MLFRKRMRRVDKDILHEFAVSLGTEIGVVSTVSASSVDAFHKDETNSGLDRAQYSQVVVEFIYLFVHLTDRVSSGIVKFERDRSWFLNLLFAQIVEWFRAMKALKNLPPNISPKFKKFELHLSLQEKIKVNNNYRAVWQMWQSDKRKRLPENALSEPCWDSISPEEMNIRDMEYAECDLCPAEKYGPWVNTVFRKFAEHVSEIVTGETGFTGDTYSHVMFIMGLAIDADMELNICRERFEKILQR